MPLVFREGDYASIQRRFIRMGFNSKGSTAAGPLCHVQDERRGGIRIRVLSRSPRIPRERWVYIRIFILLCRDAECKKAMLDRGG